MGVPRSYVQIATDILIYIFVTTFSLLFAFEKLNSIEPFRRGFFCDDQDLMYPYKSSTVGSSSAAVISALPPVLLILVTEFILREKFCKKSVYIKTCYHRVGSFLFGFSLSLLFVEILKLFIGRLRPHFFDVCLPNVLLTNCTNYVTDYVCRGTEKNQIIDARKSFPSGHAAASWYGMTYFIIFMQIRVRNRWHQTRLICPVLQTTALCVASYVSITRIQDNKHHPADIIGGAVIGATFAILTVIMNSELRKHLRCRHKSEWSDDSIICKDLNLSQNSASTIRSDHNGSLALVDEMKK